jgi:hypothetical protein
MLTHEELQTIREWPMRPDLAVGYRNGIALLLEVVDAAVAGLKAYRADPDTEQSSMDHRNCLRFTMIDGGAIDDRCPLCIAADDLLAQLGLLSY